MRRRAAARPARRLLLVVASLCLCMTGCDLFGGCEREQVTTDTGLRVQDLRCGAGDEAVKGDEVAVRYEGRLEDGDVFDASGATPYRFVVGAGQVIAGWDEGVQGMREGGVRKLIVPPHLALGEQSVPGKVPRNATLVFELTLVEVTPTSHSE